MNTKPKSKSTLIISSLSLALSCANFFIIHDISTSVEIANKQLDSAKKAFQDSTRQKYPAADASYVRSNENRHKILATAIELGSPLSEIKKIETSIQENANARVKYCELKNDILDEKTDCASLRTFPKPGI